nr:hypothetical protein [Mycolicibacterium chubuense]
MAHWAIGAAAAAAVLTACAATSHASPAAPAPHTKNWFDLDAGDCITDVPAVDTGEVTVTVVDCAAPHRAEVFLRRPTAVDTAVTDVADTVCAAGLARYTGGGPFVADYLIDSNQDRTSADPLPSTIICLLEAGNGGLLTTSARKA